MTDKIVKELYELNNQTYKKYMPKEYKNWLKWDEYHNKKTGFSGWAYKKDGKILMIVKGTDIPSVNDVKNDWALANNKMPDQLQDARKFRQKIVQENFSMELIQTGYSLGGSIVMALGSATGDRTYTFGAYGIKDFAGKDSKYSKNITNYGYYKDPVFNSNRDNMIGKVYMTGQKNEKIKIESTNPANISTHFYKFVYDTDNNQEYTPKEHLTVRENLLNGNYSLFNHLSRRQKVSILSDLAQEHDNKLLGKSVSKARKFAHKTEDNVNNFKEKAQLALRPAQRLKQRLQEEWKEVAESKNEMIEKFKRQETLSGYVNYFTKSERIYTREEIDNMTYKTRKKLKEAINYQKEKIGIPTKELAKKAVQSGGMVHVKEYVRAGGVQVKSYYRAKPSR